MAGAGPASLQVERGEAGLPSEFAKPSGYQIYRPGATRLALVLNGQEKPVATEKVRLAPGKYTVVAIGGKGGVDLLVYKDDGVQPGKATLRAIHAAAEVGQADVRLDGKVVVTGVGLGDATGYLPVPPGRHTVAVTRPGGKGGALVKAKVRAVAGTASSAFVVGSAGMPAAVVLTNDGSAGPSAAPATGLGGAAPDGSWLLILGSSLIGGTLGGASYFLSRRVRTRGAMVVSPAGVSADPPKSSLAAGPPVAPKTEAEEVVAEAPSLKPIVAEAPAPARPVLWTPPPGERWLSAPGPSHELTPVLAGVGGDPSSPPSTSRFIRPDADVADPPKLPRFIIPDNEAAAPAPRFMRPPPVDPGAPEHQAPVEFDLPDLATELQEPEPESAPVEAAVNTESEATTAATEAIEEPMPTMTEPENTTPPEQIQSSGPTPRFGVTEPATPRPTPFWERGDQPTQPLRPALGTPEPEIVSPEPEIVSPAAPEETVSPEPGPLAPAASGEDKPWTFPVPKRVEPTPAPPAFRTLTSLTEPVAQPTPEPEAEVTPEPKPEPQSSLRAVPDATPAQPESSGSATDTGVSTWSSASAKRPSSHSTAHDVAGKVNFLVVSGAALVVTGLVVARRGGRH